MRVVNEQGASTISYEGTEYTAVNGVFDLPEAVGAHMTGFPGWWSEYEYHRHLGVEERAQRTDADVIADRIQALEDRVAALEAKPRVGRPPKQS